VCVCYCGWVVIGAVVIRYKLPILRAQHTDKQTTLCVTHVGMGRIHTPHVGNVAPQKTEKKPCYYMFIGVISRSRISFKGAFAEQKPALLNPQIPILQRLAIGNQRQL